MPPFQSESKCQTILMKMALLCMKMKLHAELIFIRKVSHLDSFWNRGTRELGNGLLSECRLSDHVAVYWWVESHSAVVCLPLSWPFLPLFSLLHACLFCVLKLPVMYMIDVKIFSQQITTSSTIYSQALFSMNNSNHLKYKWDNYGIYSTFSLLLSNSNAQKISQWVQK